MGKISNFFKKTGVAIGTLVASIALAVNVGLARAPLIGAGTEGIGGLGVVAMAAGVLTVGAGASIVKLAVTKRDEQKLLGTDKSGRNVYGDKSNKNIYTKTFAGCDNHPQNAASQRGESFGKTAAQMGENIGKAAANLGKEIGRGAEKMGIKMDELFSDSRKRNNQNPYSAGNNRNTNNRPNPNGYRTGYNNGYNGQNGGMNGNNGYNGNAYSGRNGNGAYGNNGYRNNGAYPNNGGQNSAYGNNGRQNGANGYPNNGYQNASNGNNSSNHDAFSAYDHTMQKDGRDESASSNYFNNAPGNSQYRSGPLKKNK